MNEIDRERKRDRERKKVCERMRNIDLDRVTILIIST